MDLVSVIIPYYKKRNFIKETIVSVINQSYNNLEILIIYDDTNFNDFEFLKELSKIDNRIKIIGGCCGVTDNHLKSLINKFK